MSGGGGPGLGPGRGAGFAPRYPDTLAVTAWAKALRLVAGEGEATCRAGRCADFVGRLKGRALLDRGWASGGLFGSALW